MLALILVGALRGERSVWLVTEIAVALLGVALSSSLFDKRTEGVTFYGAFTDDAFAPLHEGAGADRLAGRRCCCRSTSCARTAIGGFEFPILLILLSTLGMLMLISASDFIALYLGLELMSLALYVSPPIDRDDLPRRPRRASNISCSARCRRACCSTALSLIYGFAGTVSFAGVAAALNGQAPVGVMFGLVFVLAGLAFKISAVPFHMWTPDVYEGAPTPVTAFFASAPQDGGDGGAGARPDHRLSRHMSTEWRQIVTFISIASMALGSFAAIGQTNIKRLMAYSSIGHMGFALVGLAAGTVEGAQGVVVYMAIYLVMTLGTFAGILSMRRDGHYVETIADLAGLSRTNPPMAFFLAAMMFSLAGIPPLAGFFAKFYVFAAAINAGLYGLAVIGVLLSVGRRLLLSAHRQDHVFRRAGAGVRPRRRAPRASCSALSTALLILGVFAPAPLTDAAMAAAQVAVLRRPIAQSSRGASRSQGWRVERFDSARQHQRRGAAPRARRRSRPALDRRRRADGGARPARPRLALAAPAISTPARCCSIPARWRIAPQLGFVAGVALRARRSRISAARGVALKWPNDLVAGGAKLAGILLEGWSLGGGALAVRRRHRRQSAPSHPDGSRLSRRPISPRCWAARSACGEFARAARRALRRARSPPSRAAPALRRSARNGSTAPPGSASRCARPRRAARARACSRASTRAAVCFCGRRDAIEAIESADIALSRARPPKRRGRRQLEV